MPATVEPIPKDGLAQPGQAEVRRVEAIPQLSRILFGTTIFLSAFLLFFVQLLLAKRILPIFGGAPSVWTSCIMFFQILLLAGYVLAHFLASRLNPRKQSLIVVALLAISIGILIVTALAWPTPITPNVASGVAFFGNPSLAIVKFLFLSIGLPFLILSTTSPLIQHWFATVFPGASPYRLYALSNAGSLLGLLAYPFLLEPMLRLPTQAWLWTSAYVFYAASYSACAFWSQKTKSDKVDRDTETAQPGGEELGWGRPTLWIAVSFFASTLLLSTTNYICQEVAVIPFLWVLPLSVYLLSFILTFEGGRWYKRNFFHALLALSVVGVVLVTPLNANYSYLTQTVASIVLLFAGCMVCHGEAFRLRPSSPSLTRFYLSISSGGALGGIFVNLIAPRIFPGYWEYPLSVLGTTGLLLFIVEKDGDSWLHRGKVWLAVAMASLIVFLLTMELAQLWPQSSWLNGLRPRLITVGIAGLALALYAKSRQEKQEPKETPFVRLSVAVLFLLFITGFVLPIRDFYTDVLAVSRNFYGVLTVVLDKPNNYLTLWHGKTAHGFQFLRPDLEHLPTGYYGQHSGANILLRNWQGGPVRVALVGMGAGTLAALGRSGDTYRFYEINPDVPKYSSGEKPFFTFVRDSKAHVEIVLGDARLSLEQEAQKGTNQKFDVLVLDAFSSDSIPLHLLTREAFAIYLRQLRDRDSVIAVHISNKTLNLGPVLAGIAKEFHLQTVRTHPTWMGGFSASSDWILLSPSSSELSSSELKAASVPFPDKAEPILWTDDFSNLVRVLR
jgi:hypothetical protein